LKHAERKKLYNHQALFEKQQAHKKRVMDFASKFGAKASKARQAQSRLKMLEKMDMVEALQAERSTKFTFPQPEDIGSPIITLKKVDVGYEPGKPILKNLTLRVDMADRIALLGANGNGKSTLVKLLSGKLEAMAGELDRDGKLRVGYFAQHQSDEMDTNLTPYQTMREFIKDVPEHNIRAMLGKFGFDKGKADTRIEELSGGEKARLLFCMMSYDAPHIMLLDEPTNHLDMDARAALIQALNGYDGCVILVSHDPHLVEAVADQLWLVKDGAVTDFNGNLEEYRELIIEQRRKERSGAKKEKNKDNNEGRGGKNNRSKNKRNYALEKAEQNLSRWSKEVQELENEMSSEKALMHSGFMNDLLDRYKVAQKEFEQAETTWLEESEKASA
jgi:ATP-binding cassette subfamily F protein 3